MSKPVITQFEPFLGYGEREFTVNTAVGETVVAVGPLWLPEGVNRHHDELQINIAEFASHAALKGISVVHIREHPDPEVDLFQIMKRNFANRFVPMTQTRKDSPWIRVTSDVEKSVMAVYLNSTVASNVSHDHFGDNLDNPHSWAERFNNGAIDELFPVTNSFKELLVRLKASRRSHFFRAFSMNDSAEIPQISVQWPAPDPIDAVT